ncbi:pantoate--beta-alanine ligase [Lichenicoccus sp.]|uniref:pantoate--beta-alanine ligase n=1 Tax=Lichenicoccus sp. TaxID=2781899 RepID=UPI003D0A707E
MLVARTMQDLTRARAATCNNGETLALVPTMGALHKGHLSLLEAARARHDRIAVSIFINPTQFNDADDLARYPRSEDDDLKALRTAGCDLVWMPTTETMYPDGDAVRVALDGPARGWEGAHRPGHFNGVATVVTKLFNQIGPASAFFGEKDWQQLQVIRSVAGALFLPLTIEGVATVREADGLAMSSRNRLLAAEDRRRAPALYQGLLRADAAIAQGDCVSVVLNTAREDLLLRGFDVDYLALVDATSLSAIDGPTGGARLIAAARLGDVRLLDNIPLAPAIKSRFV